MLNARFGFAHIPEMKYSDGRLESHVITNFGHGPHNHIYSILDKNPQYCDKLTPLFIEAGFIPKGNSFFDTPAQLDQKTKWFVQSQIASTLESDVNNTLLVANWDKLPDAAKTAEREAIRAKFLADPQYSEIAENLKQLATATDESKWVEEHLEAYAKRAIQQLEAYHIEQYNTLCNHPVWRSLTDENYYRDQFAVLRKTKPYVWEAEKARLLQVREIHDAVVKPRVGAGPIETDDDKLVSLLSSQMVEIMRNKLNVLKSTDVTKLKDSVSRALEGFRSFDKPSEKQGKIFEEMLGYIDFKTNPWMEIYKTTTVPGLKETANMAGWFYDPPHHWLFRQDFGFEHPGREKAKLQSFEALLHEARIRSLGKAGYIDEADAKMAAMGADKAEELKELRSKARKLCHPDTAANVKGYDTMSPEERDKLEREMRADFQAAEAAFQKKDKDSAKSIQDIIRKWEERKASSSQA